MGRFKIKLEITKRRRKSKKLHKNEKYEKPRYATPKEEIGDISLCLHDAKCPSISPSASKGITLTALTDIYLEALENVGETFKQDMKAKLIHVVKEILIKSLQKTNGTPRQEMEPNNNKTPSSSGSSQSGGSSSVAKSAEILVTNDLNSVDEHQCTNRISPSYTIVEECKDSHQEVTKNNMTPVDDFEEEPDKFIPDERNVDSVSPEISSADPDRLISSEKLAGLLGVSEKYLSHRPKKKFLITLKSAVLSAIFDFSTKKFVVREYAGAISEAINEATDRCCYNVKKAPVYHKSIGFCTLNGHCGCGAKFTIFGKMPPKENLDYIMSVTSKDHGKTVQDKYTGRQLRGKERKEMATRLLHNSSIKTFLSNNAKTSGLNLLHGNLKQPSLGTLQKLKSEQRLKERTSTNPVIDVKNLEKEHRETHNNGDNIEGFIHNVVGDEDLTLYIYDKLSLELHYEVMKKQTGIVYIDATGSLVRKYNDKPVLSFLLLGSPSPKSRSYIIAELVTTVRTQNSPKNFLTHLKDKLVDKIGATSSLSFCKIAVCDFSIPLIFALVRSLCEMTVAVYLYQTGEIFSEPKRPFNKPVIYVCAAHLIKAFSRNLKKKLPKDKIFIVDTAMYALAKLAETKNKAEFDDVSRRIIWTFGLRKLSHFVLDENLEFFRSQQPDELIPEQTEKEEEECLELPPDFKTLREQSPFYKFVFILTESYLQGTEGDENDNKYYCPAVLNVLQKTYIAFYSFWSRFMVVTTKDSSFQRETNAVIESQFNLKKSHINVIKNDYLSNYIRVTKDYFIGSNKTAALEMYRGKAPSKRNQKSNAKDSPSLVTEIWKRRIKRRKTSKYLSVFTKNETSNGKRPDKCSPSCTNTQKQPTPCKLRVCSTSINRQNLLTPVRKQKANPRRIFKHTIDKETTNVNDGEIICKLSRFFVTKRELKVLFQAPYWFSNLVVDAYFLFDKHARGNFVASPSHSATYYGCVEGWQGVGIGAFNSEELARITEKTEILHPLLVPNHWRLLCIKLRDGVCIIMDSLNQSSDWLPDEEVRNVIPRFIELCPASKDKAADWEIRRVAVPRQTQNWTCGVHVLMNAEHIIRTGNLQFTTRNKKMENDMKYKIITDLLRTTVIGGKIADNSRNSDDIERLLGF